ncbi:MAG: undecaprenyl-diphosphatase UppP [Candidatus Aquicultor secundus]|uniref:Undecaprenyl-diphosphatase n=1 Tax=Candidatus Aquicultor secundus TaxID=1973895 RepID=A0A2M7T7F6_9ACTN|nr:undecaprenyl-diphosphatase UppP [Candidatus Aquicultor secundus]NCO65644.1 undecaprenyl-diphosphatase UppP [Solirubrobacter sp.]OIO88938.1 MAG: undecaprenyl-diphosphatase UppP [Candidatus Aquicultor secundus]PIU26449.1 MAG: undecaprenyl-diphosphatase UppP [Candidatus Aquicultor secundus]PIW21174.1 MAG: undecaprenyl-diphosphatase UppP [Candidatus Aquicultor secundus]PIX52981.1 MAG: undecaprenyl-diphosphatase UppP [Candidatus Aquicultor secundus]
MNVIQAAILGIIQGLTEFLPISSSAHLVLFPLYMGWHVNPEANVTYDVIVHFGTLMAVLTFFYKDVSKLASALIKSIFERKIGNDPYRRMAWFLIIGTIPTGIVYLFIKKLLEDTLKTPSYVGIFLLITGVLLVAGERIGKRAESVNDLKTTDVVFIGFVQGLAILPGISRSGSTIAAGLFRGLTREEAARFSFLLSIPVIVAAALEKIKEVASAGVHGGELAILIAGFVTAAITGYFAIKYFLDYLKKHSLYVFALYCFALGATTIALTALKVLK